MHGTVEPLLTKTAAILYLAARYQFGECQCNETKSASGRLKTVRVCLITKNRP